MSKPQIAHIVATLENGVIGTNNDLPWPMWKEDMAFFREKTTGNIVVMGYNTILSLPKRLPNRVMVALSYSIIRESESNPTFFERIDFGVNTLECLLDVIGRGKELPSLTGKDIFIAGGGATYRNTIGEVDIVYQNVLKPTTAMELGDVETVTYPIELLDWMFTLQSSEEIDCDNGKMVKNVWVRN